MNAFPYPKKRFGQNFLQNKQIAAKIINSLDIDKEDVVLEIGPGRGILTEFLSKEECKLKYALEIDSQLFNYLHRQYSSSVEILNQDILSYSFEKLYNKTKMPIKVVGNIPYNITSSILFHILENNSYITLAVLMVQKEVANRLIAKQDTKDYGILTIMANVQSKIEKLFNVGRNNFKPQPNVDSAVIRITPETINNLNVDMDLFKLVVRSTFNNRRKMLRNTLCKVVDKNVVDGVRSISLDSRPENLSINDFVNLTKEIDDLSKRK